MGSEFTDRFALDMPGKPENKPSGNHPFDKVCASAGIKHRLTKPYHPQTTGMVERFNRRINQAIGREQKSGIAHRLFGSHQDRDAFLTSFVGDYNHTRLKCLDCTAPKQVLANLAGPNTKARIPAHSSQHGTMLEEAGRLPRPPRRRRGRTQPQCTPRSWPCQ
jgi:hypothetical protein